MKKNFKKKPLKRTPSSVSADSEQTLSHIVGIQNGPATLETKWAVSSKGKQTFTR